MNKSYQPMFPTSSRILQKKWDDKHYSEHRVLVRDARASVDTRPPRTYMHLHMKLKKLQLEEERTATIERDNRILLEKMTHIMRTTGGIDNHNTYESKSLNQEKRRRELLRVSKENSIMVKRIMERKPDINRNKSNNGWSKTSSCLDNLVKYDPDGHLSKPTSHQTDPEKPLSKQSESATREGKDIEGLVMKNATATNDEAQK